MAFRIKSLAAGCAIALLAGLAQAQDLAPLNSDTEADRLNWSDLQSNSVTCRRHPPARASAASRRR